MPKKDTKLEKLSEKIHITVEEIRNLGVENLVHCFVNVLSLIKKSPCILPVKCLCRNIVLFYKP